MLYKINPYFPALTASVYYSHLSKKEYFILLSYDFSSYNIWNTFNDIDGIDL